MSDQKMIEVSADVFDQLAEHKGDNTWNEHLRKMADAAFGDVAYLDAPTIDDFVDQENEASIGTVETPADGELRLMFELSDGKPAAIAEMAELPSNEEITINLEKGNVIDD